jgi:hypothetical protein
MQKLTDKPSDVQAVIGRDDLVRFLYPIRLDLTTIARRLDNLNRKLDSLAPRWRPPIAALQTSRARR